MSKRLLLGGGRRRGAQTAPDQDDSADAGAVARDEHKLKFLSMSFATKFLFFMDPHGRALVLDDFVAGWLKTTRTYG